MKNIEVEKISESLIFYTLEKEAEETYSIYKEKSLKDRIFSSDYYCLNFDEDIIKDNKQKSIVYSYCLNYLSETMPHDDKLTNVLLYLQKYYSEINLKHVLKFYSSDNNIFEILIKYLIYLHSIQKIKEFEILMNFTLDLIFSIFNIKHKFLNRFIGNFLYIFSKINKNYSSESITDDPKVLEFIFNTKCVLCHSFLDYIKILYKGYSNESKFFKDIFDSELLIFDYHDNDSFKEKFAEHRYNFEKAINLDKQDYIYRKFSSNIYDIEDSILRHNMYLKDLYNFLNNINEFEVEEQLQIYKKEYDVLSYVLLFYYRNDLNKYLKKKKVNEY